MKLLGSLFIMAGGGAVWYLQLQERKRHQTLLEDLLYRMRSMGEEIRQTRTPLLRILERMAERNSSSATFFAAVSDAVCQGELLSTAWKNETERLALCVGEREILLRLGDSLGGDEEQVCKAISLATYDLAKRVEEVVRHRPEADRKSSALCFSSAALLVILLL